MPEPSPAPRRSHWRLWLVIALTILIVMGLFVSGINRQREQPALHIGEELELRLQGMLTEENPDLDTTTFAAKLHDELPAALRSHFPKGHGERFLQAGVEDGDLYLYLTPAYQPEKRRGRPQSEAATAMQDRFSSRRRPMVRLKYGEGWYSQANGISNFTSSRGNDLYSVNFSHVPKTLESLDLQLVTMPQVPEEVLHSITLNNPLYRQIDPLETTQTLPQTLTRDGISITLSHLVAKTVNSPRDKNQKRKDRHGDSNYPKLPEGHFLRAAGTLNDQYHGVAVISISEAGTTTTEWDIAEDDGLTFSYGKAAVPFGPAFFSKELVSSSGADRTYLCSYGEDLDMLAQPVTVSVQLEHIQNFQPDEEQTVSIAIPSTGTTAKAGSVTRFWNGPVTIEVGNQAEFSPPMMKVSSTDYLAVVVNGPYKNVRILEPVLEGPDVAVLDLDGYRYFDDYRSGSKALYFATVKGRGSRAKPVDLTRYTTLSLTLRSPKKIATTFDFIAEPTDAQVPAAEAR